MNRADAGVVDRVRAWVDDPSISRDDLLRQTVRALHERPAYHWTGIYLVEGYALVLHDYLGRATDHVRIPIGRGVCGRAVALGRNLNVPDVTQAEDYLACSAETRSEIVVLIRTGDRIHGQIDIDSDEAAAFGPDDERLLEAVAAQLARRFA